MLPYFKYTEDVQSFCQLMGYDIDIPEHHTGYVCTYTYPSEHNQLPYITSYHLGCEASLLIPPEKVIPYLILMLNGYSYIGAVKELSVVG